MPNQCQPQGLTKVVVNPAIDLLVGVPIVNFEIQESDGVAIASHLHIRLDDPASEINLLVILNPAILRTRSDVMRLSIETVNVIGLEIYCHSGPTRKDGLDFSIPANTTQTVTITKENNVISFDLNGECKRIELSLSEDGSTTTTP